MAGVLPRMFDVVLALVTGKDGKPIFTTGVGNDVWRVEPTDGGGLHYAELLQKGAKQPEAEKPATKERTG